ncbi:xanthine dehydrogenase family protein molybdopterin-binding subunit [Ramlibacter sp.]|uniref:xanthine dehydrogenase family protein molybdopterin-binding subunit n=1 Tax=Ramlibacter sp. TaxID=1917967 RepID=UPI002626C33B|nr:xanthine dehydrogenase family protein molybdopterin-binding subunit [Ramlibacter sp.]MDB5955204.1 xanthine dehydrogenase [Ramlibacter sp.]
MEMNQPAPRNPLDENRHGNIGRALDRVDGPQKVTGTAPYAYEVQEAPSQPAYGFIVEAAIGKGRAREIDTSAAERAPGVLLVLTHRNTPGQASHRLTESQRFDRPHPMLGDPLVPHYGQPVAFVVAESFEQARAASLLVRVHYEELPAHYVMKDHLADAEKPSEDEGKEPDSEVGDFETGFAVAPVRIDVQYTTPVHIHAQMEPHAALAWWEGERVIVHCSTQMLESAQKRIANTLRMPEEKVRVFSRYIGGGFGGKLPVWADVILSVLASKVLQRPVKTALTRQQMFHVTSHRPDTVQRVRLGAERDGRLLAIGHEAWCHSARLDDYLEPVCTSTRNLYAAANRMTRQRRVKLDLPVADSCRSPGEAVGMPVLECAMDELALALGMDPVALRIANEPKEDPEKHIPYSTRQLIPCLEEGARRFAWERRNPQPGQMREGRFLIGMGMASASRSNKLQQGKCKLKIGSDGMLVARMSMTDIGTGSYTVFTQIAAEMFGLPVERVRIELGDSDFPATAGSGGSFGAATAGSALFVACENLRRKLAQAAGIAPEQAEFADGHVRGGGKSALLATLAGQEGIEAEGEIKPGAMDKRYTQMSYGAFFCEVSVDTETGEVRVRRMLGVFAAGRILNAKTARSQLLGAMIWGVGTALHEEAALDGRYGYFANHDLAEYHVPVHADIPAIDAILLPEVDDKANPLKIKGVGELGISGAAAAVANAVYNACGVRVREFPITLDKVLAGLP